MIHKTRKFEGLDELPVYITDNSTLSPNYFNITYLPKTLHAGKNIIRVKGNDENLAIGSAVYIELLDFNGNPIYHEIADYLYEDKSRIIVIYIYEDTPPGEANLTILGEAKVGLNGEPIPSEFKRVPNVKWTANFSVDNSQRNNTEIIFTDNNVPDISVTEKIRPYLDRGYETTQYVTQSAGTVDYKLRGQNATLTLTGDRFRREQIGATVKITPNNAQPALNISVDDSTYWTTIKDIPTTSSAVLSDKYYLEANNSNYTYTAVEMTNCSYEIHYEADPIYTQTQNLRSLARIQVNNIEPASGEVYRAKTFIRSKGSSAAWELVDDTVLKESDFQDILIDTGSIDIKTRIGDIRGNYTINNYWSSELYQRQTGTTILEPPTFISTQTLTYDTGSKLLDSMYISSDTVTTYPEQFVKVTPSGSLGIIKKTFESNGEYVLSFNAVAVKSSLLGSDRVPYIEFYISGSAFSSKKPDYSFGKKIGELDVQKIDPGSSGLTFRFENKIFDFTADNDGNGFFIMKVNSGDWYISDLSIKPSTEQGFNPCQNTAVIAVPTEHQNDQLDFKIEYYDYQNNQSKYISYCEACDFAGGNTYIGGVKNLLTGSLFVGNGTGSGVEINGITGGFVRSVGYVGFDSASATTGEPGFAIWSGSGLTQDSGEDYNGVGLEMHAGGSNGSFKFRTHPTPKLEVITPAFFFGNASNFVSGSNGNIEIYSNGGVFHLKPSGQVTASGVHVVDSLGNVLLDTARRYADLLNLGRVWYNSTDEVSAIPPTVTAAGEGGAATNKDGEVLAEGVTYILAGETSIQLNAHYEFRNPGSSNCQYIYHLTFMEANSGSYDNFYSGSEEVVASDSDFIVNSVPLAKTTEGIIAIRTGGSYGTATNVASFAGKLVKWKFRVYYNNGFVQPTHMKFKNIVIRSSGEVGSSRSGDSTFPSIPIGTS